MVSKKQRLLQQEQKITKPKIEEVIGDFLDGDALRNALDFVNYLRDNNMNLRWSATSTWTIKHKSKRVCLIRLHGSAWQYDVDAGSWHIECFNLLSILDGFDSCEALKEILWANVKHCTNCCSCGPGWNKEIMGRQFDNVCRLVIKNPDAKALEYAIKLVNASKEFIAKNNQKIDLMKWETAEDANNAQAEGNSNPIAHDYFDFIDMNSAKLQNALLKLAVVFNKSMNQMK